MFSRRFVKRIPIFKTLVLERNQLSWNSVAIGFANRRQNRRELGFPLVTIKARHLRQYGRSPRHAFGSRRQGCGKCSCGTVEMSCVPTTGLERSRKRSELSARTPRLKITEPAKRWSVSRSRDQREKYERLSKADREERAEQGLAASIDAAVGKTDFGTPK